jgi:hypothetical protein
MRPGEHHFCTVRSMFYNERPETCHSRPWHHDHNQPHTCYRSYPPSLRSTTCNHRPTWTRAVKRLSGSMTREPLLSRPNPSFETTILDSRHYCRSSVAMDPAAVADKRLLFQRSANIWNCYAFIRWPSTCLPSSHRLQHNLVIDIAAFGSLCHLRRYHHT